MKSVFTMRLVLYGLALYVVTAVLAMQADPRPPGTSALFHGQTPEGLLVSVAAEHGEVQSAYLRWRMTCLHAQPKVTTIHVGPEWGDRFEHDGREFSFSGRSEQPETATKSVRYEVWLAGRLSEDQRTATGHGRTVETWFEGGQVADVCQSDDVRWAAYRGAERG